MLTWYSKSSSVFDFKCLKMYIYNRFADFSLRSDSIGNFSVIMELDAIDTDFEI